MPTSPVVKTIAAVSPVGQVLDRAAIARARIAHLTRQQVVTVPAAVSPLLSPARYDAQASKVAGSTSTRTVTVVDLTDD